MSTWAESVIFIVFNSLGIQMLCYLIEESVKFQPVADEAMFISSGCIEPVDETLDPLEILIAREEREAALEILGLS
jgi:hypothetical protein